ncbi:MAG: carboxypeptidase regulatory-like domain-containing protein, partial [Bryobacteraceae bacterium]
MSSRLTYTCLLLACASSALFGQSTLGTITGIVTDATGAVVPNASVTARNTATGVQAATVSSSTGNYVLPSLPIGTYDVSVSAAGFKAFTQSGVVLQSNDNARIDAILEVGQTSERIQVTAEAPPLKTESTEVSTAMEQKLVEDLPLPIAGIGGGMRNAFSIMMMMPQVKSGNGESSWDDMQVGGGQQHDWNLSVDGLSVEMGWRNHVGYMNRLTPAIDAVEEFRIETAAFKAEDSRASGGNITIITKSGTNTFHGTLFEYYQSQRFDANTWGNNRLGRAKPVYHRNDFGATGGGPILLPKIYDGRNRSYFYLSFEGYRNPQTSGVSELTIPLAEMKAGDFSNYKKPDGTLIPIYDPTTTRSDGKGGFIRDPFPGNIIPASQISPLASRIVDLMPDPNASGLLRNYRTPGSMPRNRIENSYLMKFDHAFGVKNRASFSWSKNGYHWNNAYDTDPTNPMNWGGQLPYPLSGRQYYRGDQYYGNVFRVNDTHLFTPTLVNNLTLGFHRLTHPEHDVTAVPPGQNWGDRIGSVANNPGANYAFPAVDFATDQYYGWESTKYWDEYHNVFGLSEHLSWIKRSHSFKFGYEYQKMFLNINNRNNAAGSHTFHRLGTALPGDNSGDTGNSFASFMLGQVHNGGFNIPNTLMMRWPYHAFFLQDDWKITPRLTANLGIRYEMNLSVYEKHDRFSSFDPALPNPAANGYPGALRFLGEGEGREGRRNLHNTASG